MAARGRRGRGALRADLPALRRDVDRAARDRRRRPAHRRAALPQPLHRLPCLGRPGRRRLSLAAGQRVAVGRHA